MLDKVPNQASVHLQCLSQEKDCPILGVGKSSQNFSFFIFDFVFTSLSYLPPLHLGH